MILEEDFIEWKFRILFDIYTVLLYYLFLYTQFLLFYWIIYSYTHNLYSFITWFSLLPFFSL